MIKLLRKDKGVLNSMRIRKFFICVIAMVMSVVLLCSLTGCNKENKEIENLMIEFEYSCNTLDFDAVLNCINPKVSEKVKLAVGIVGIFTEKDTDELFEKLANYLSDGDIGGTEFFSSIKIDVKEITAKKESAVVLCTISCEAEGQKLVREATFNCIKYAEKWYISKLSFS